MHQGYYIFNLKETVQLIKQKIWFILLLSFGGFLIAFGITKVFLKPVYTSKVSFYVSNTEQLQNKIDYSDINAAQKLANLFGDNPKRHRAVQWSRCPTCTISPLRKSKG